MTFPDSELDRAIRVPWTAVKEKVPPPESDGFLLPPPNYRDKVVLGVFTARGFLPHGRAVANTLRSAMDSLGQPLGRGSAVYEWGCGCGRVIRHLMPLGVEASGSDVDPELIA